MQRRSAVRYRLDHQGPLLGMVVLVVCIRARSVIHTPYVRPLLLWTGVYPGTPGYTPVQRSNGRQKPCPPSGALGGKVGSCALGYIPTYRALREQEICLVGDTMPGKTKEKTNKTATHLIHSINANTIALGNFRLPQDHYFIIANMSETLVWSSLLSMMGQGLNPLRCASFSSSKEKVVTFIAFCILDN